MRSLRQTLALGTAAGLLLASGIAFAMGGGGGGMGSMPSASQPEYDPVTEYQRGKAALDSGRYRDAVQAFENVTDATPKAANAWYMLGLSKAGDGDVKGAEKAYERSVKLDDTSIDAHRELALSQVKLKQTDKAQGELATLKARAATCADACPDAADLKAAVDAVQNALPPDAGAPSSAPAAAPAKPAAANAVPPSLSLASPRAGDGAYVRAVSLINEHRYQEALRALDAAEAAIGPHPDILTYKGYVWRKLGAWDKAQDYYRQALAIDPGHRGATEYYGELKVLLGDKAGAEAMLAKLDAACAFGCAEAVELRRWIDHGGDPAS
jgi:tetratricopeptide (TPR) repeat protein